MTVKLSYLIGLDIYTDTAQFIGKVYDIIIDLEKGEIVRLTLEPIKAASKDDAKRIFKEKTVLYKTVKAVEKIVIISPNITIADEPEEAPAQPAFQSKSMPYSYRYRRP